MCTCLHPPPPPHTHTPFLVIHFSKFLQEGVRCGNNWTVTHPIIWRVGKKKRAVRASADLWSLAVIVTFARQTKESRPASLSYCETE